MRTEPITFTAADVVAQVRALAAANPDYVYPGALDGGECSYVYDRLGSGTGQGCLIGQALQALGVEREWLRDHGDDAISMPNAGPSSASQVLRSLGVADDGDSYEFLDDVQARQDGGERWGGAALLATWVLE